MSYHNPFAMLKYAVEAVPFFDGNNIPLNYFIEGCEEAKSMLPEEIELQLTKIIRTRIIGEARRTIQDQFFNSISQLTSYLRRIYGSSKNVYQLQGELGCIYQKDEEDVISYASRIRTLGKQILEAYQYVEKVLPDKNIKTSLEKNMCECFIRGLKSNIEQRITRNLNLEETIVDALRIERELREIVNLRQKQDVNSSQNEVHYTNWLQEACQICFKKGHIANNCRKLTQFSPQNYNETNLETKILICQICNKRRHSADNCRLRTLRYRQPIKIIREEVISCQLCFESSHDAKSCPQNDINNQANKMSVICQWCEKSGHSAKNCWKKQNEEYKLKDKQPISCQICNNFGHIAKNCCSKISQNSTFKNNSFCRYCKEQGHLLKNCQLRIATNNYRDQNNQKNYNNFSMPNIKEVQTDFKPVLENQADCRVMNAQPVTINLDKRGRVPTIQVNINDKLSQTIFMIDTGSSPNLIKENFISKDININYTKILQLNGINNYPVYTLGKIVLNLFKIPVPFYIVSHDFPIPQAGILGNDFLKQTSSKINYAQGCLIVSGINNIPFFTPEMITVPPRSESLFYVRVENSEIKVGYVPKIKIAHGINLGDTIVKNIAGKAYLNVQSTLDEEMDVHVPIIRLTSLNSLFTNQETNFKVLRNQEPIDKKEEATHEAFNKTFNKFDDCESKVEIEDKTKNRQNEDYQDNIIIKEAQDKDKKEILNQGENKNKIQTQNKNEINCENKTMNKNEKKNKDYRNNLNRKSLGGRNYQTPPENINNPKILGEGNYQTLPKNINDPKILGGGNYQTPPENVNNPKILGRGNYQTSPEKINNPKILKKGSFQAPSKRKNSRILEGNFQTSLENSSSVDCEEGNYQTSLCNSTRFNPKNLKERRQISSLNINFPRIRLFTRNLKNKLESSRVADDVIKRAQIYNLKMKNFCGKNKPSSKLLYSSHIKTQEVIEKFMRTRKSQKEENIENQVINPNNCELQQCFIDVEETTEDQPKKIMELSRLKPSNGKLQYNVEDTLSSKPVSFKEVKYKFTTTKTILNLNNPEDTEAVSETLIGFDNKKGENNDFNLSFSNTEEIKNIIPEGKLSNINIDSSSFTFEELTKSFELQISEQTLIHNFLKQKIQTRSQTVKLKDNIKELKKRNDPPDKNYRVRNKDEKRKEMTEEEVVEVKIKQSEIITNILKSSFNITENIVKFSSKTGRSSKNILTLQDQLAKIYMKIFLSHQTSKITRIFAIRFIRTLEASKVILIYQPIQNFKSVNQVFSLKRSKAKKSRDQYTRQHKTSKKLEKDHAKMKIKINNLIIHNNRLWIFYIKFKSDEIISKELRECCSLMKIMDKPNSTHRRKRFSKSEDSYLSPPLRETSIYVTIQGLKIIKYDQPSTSHDKDTLHYLIYIYKISSTINCNRNHYSYTYVNFLLHFIFPSYYIGYYILLYFSVQIIFKKCLDIKIY